MAQNEASELTFPQTLGLASMAVSTLGNVFSMYQSSRMQSEMAAAQERIAKINQQRAVIQAHATLAASNRNIASITAKYGEMKSQQRVAMAGNNVAINYGSNKEILATTDLYKQMDANTAYANGINAAMGYMNKATAQYQSAVAAGASGSNSKLVAAESLLGSVSNIAGYYTQLAFKEGGKAAEKNDAVGSPGNDSPMPVDPFADTEYI